MPTPTLSTSRLVKRLLRQLASTISLQYLCYWGMAATVIASGCQPSTAFDQQVWLRNADMTDRYNPRRHMVEEVIHQQLHVGMSRQQVVQLLGPPYQEQNTYLLLTPISLPDSLNSPNLGKLTKSQLLQYSAGIHRFYRINGRPVRLLNYPVGWSTIDPNFLTVALTPDGRLLRSWVAQH